MVIALASTLLGFDRTPTLIFAQAVTVLGAPLIAIVLLWLTSSQDIMGDSKNGSATKVLGVVGLVLLFGMAYRTAFHSIPAQWADWTKPAEEVSEAEQTSGEESEDATNGETESLD